MTQENMIDNTEKTKNHKFSGRHYHAKNHERCEAYCKDQ